VALRLSRRYCSSSSEAAHSADSLSGLLGISVSISFHSLGRCFHLSLSQPIGGFSRKFPRPSFPSTCLSPGQPGFGQIISPPGRSRRALCGPFVSHSSPSTLNHKFSVELSQLSSKKQARLSSSKGVDIPRLSMRPPNSSRHFHRYAPYSDVRLKAHRSPVVSSPERVLIHDISESSPSQNPAWVRAMRASWPAVRPSNVTLPSIVAFDNVPDIQSRDPPSVVLRRLKEDSSLPRYS
jgi:hypothetical protein